MGSLRAYESEEELRKLVEQRMKSGKFPIKPAEPKKPQEPARKPELDMRESVPKFIRNYDFKFGDATKIPKVQKDSQGRKIRRI